VLLKDASWRRDTHPHDTRHNDTQHISKMRHSRMTLDGECRYAGAIVTVPFMPSVAIRLIMPSVIVPSVVLQIVLAPAS
jgi:hypothetical protein